MFGKKHMKRTCRSCKHTWLVPWNLKDITLPKQPGAWGRAVKSGNALDLIARQTDQAMLVCLCSACGSNSYSQKEVRV